MSTELTNVNLLKFSWTLLGRALNFGVWRKGEAPYILHHVLALFPRHLLLPALFAGYCLDWSYGLSSEVVVTVLYFKTFRTEIQALVSVVVCSLAVTTDVKQMPIYTHTQASRRNKFLLYISTRVTLKHGKKSLFLMYSFSPKCKKKGNEDDLLWLCTKRD